MIPLSKLQILSSDDGKCKIKVFSGVQSVMKMSNNK